MVKIGNSWDTVLREEFKKEYYLKLREFLKQEYGQGTVYPDPDNIFNALKLTSYDDAKAVIIGQDPYHEPGQAHGLSFSVKRGIEPPPSLVNIYKELNADLGVPIPTHGCLEHWAEQGVLMLNTLLTVQAHRAFSHKGIGWEQFTDAAIRALDNVDRPIVFILWGRPAGEKKALIKNPNRLIIESAHPSPLSAYRGFFGSKPFSRANAYLTAHGETPIDWEVKE